VVKRHDFEPIAPSNTVGDGKWRSRIVEQRGIVAAKLGRRYVGVDLRPGGRGRR
jgi:hypothetical protein